MCLPWAWKTSTSLSKLKLKWDILISIFNLKSNQEYKIQNSMRIRLCTSIKFNLTSSRFNIQLSNLFKLGKFNSKFYSTNFPSESEVLGPCKYQVELDKFKWGLELGAVGVWLYHTWYLSIFLHNRNLRAGNFTHESARQMLPRDKTL